MTIFLSDSCARIMLLNCSPSLTLLNVQDSFGRVSQPEEPFFIEKNDQLYCVSITKHYENNFLQQKLFNISIEAGCCDDKITIKFNKRSENEDINEVILEYKNNNKSKQQIIYKISLDKTGDVVKITKNDEEDTNKEYAKEIKQLLYEDKDEDHINQHLIENIELELDSKQKEVFKKIKAHIGIQEPKEKVKEETQKDKDIEFKSTEKNVVCDCSCCDFGLQQIKECLGITT